MPPPVPPRSLLLRLYLAASRRSAGVARRALERRQAVGKEDAARLGERMGEAGRPRPDGQLAWFHAASVGEAASLIELLAPAAADPAGADLPRHHGDGHLGAVPRRSAAGDLHPPVRADGRAALGAPFPRPLAAGPRGLDRERALAGDALRDPCARHPDAARQRPHLQPQLPALAAARRHGAGAARALRPHPRPGRPRRRAADAARRRPRPAHRRGLAEGGRGALALRRGRAGAARAGLRRPAGLARRLDASWRGGGRARRPRPRPAGVADAGADPGAPASVPRRRARRDAAGQELHHRAALQGRADHRRDRRLSRRHPRRDGPLVPDRLGQLRRRQPGRRRRPQSVRAGAARQRHHPRAARAQLHRRLPPADPGRRGGARQERGRARRRHRRDDGA